jgi:hypothetical protein
MNNVQKTLIFFTLLSVGCSEPATDSYSKPLTEFTKQLDKRNINISNILGNNFTTSLNQDTSLYSVYFNRKTRVNTLVKNSSDTIFHGTANRLGKFILLNHKLTNGRFWISALAITDSTISGLADEEFQMHQIDNRIQDLILFQTMQLDTSNLYLLTPNKKALKKTFTVITSVATYQEIFIKNELIIGADSFASESSLDSISKEDFLTDNSYVQSVFPNPFIDQINVVFKSRGEYEVKITDFSGNTIVTKISTDKSISIMLPQLQSGIYILDITDLETSESESSKLIKK